MEAAPVEGITSAAQATAADHAAGGQQASSSFAAQQDAREPSTTHGHSHASGPRQREDSRTSSASDSDESQRTRVQQNGQADDRTSGAAGQYSASSAAGGGLVTPGGTRLPQVTRHATGYFGEQRVGEAVDVKKAEEAFVKLTRVLSTSPHKFDLESHINLRKELLKRKGGVKDKYLGTTWENLTVVGKDSTGAFVKTLPDALLRTLLAKDFIEFVVGRIPSLSKILPGKKQRTRNLIQNFEGCVSQEMVSGGDGVLRKYRFHVCPNYADLQMTILFSFLFSVDQAQDALPSFEQSQTSIKASWTFKVNCFIMVLTSRLWPRNTRRNVSTTVKMTS